MKWMLVVIVFGLAPVKTDLLYDSLDSCMKAESDMRAQWARMMNAAAAPDTFAELAQRDPARAAFITKQSGVGTCIPHAPISRTSN